MVNEVGVLIHQRVDGNESVEAVGGGKLLGNEPRRALPSAQRAQAVQDATRAQHYDLRAHAAGGGSGGGHGMGAAAAPDTLMA